MTKEIVIDLTDKDIEKVSFTMKYISDRKWLTKEKWEKSCSRHDMYWIRGSLNNESLGSLCIEPISEHEFGIDRNHCNVQGGYSNYVTAAELFFRGQPEIRYQAKYVRDIMKRKGWLESELIADRDKVSVGDHVFYQDQYGQDFKVLQKRDDCLVVMANYVSAGPVGEKPFKLVLGVGVFAMNTLTPKKSNMKVTVSFDGENATHREYYLHLSKEEIEEGIENGKLKEMWLRMVVIRAMQGMQLEEVIATEDERVPEVIAM